MRRVLISILIIGIIINLIYYHERHPSIKESSAGWLFTYNLCVPQPSARCVESEFALFIPKGPTGIGLPYERQHPVLTVDDARIEAELRADLIENISNQSPWRRYLKGLPSL